MFSMSEQGYIEQLMAYLDFGFRADFFRSIRSDIHLVVDEKDELCNKGHW